MGCYLSKETKTSKPSYWYPRCYNTWRPTKFLSSKYSEKTVVTDKHYTTPIPGCLWKYNTEDYSGVSSMEECQSKCDEKSWCRSLDYIPDIKMCYLSKETKTSKPSYWYPRCYNTWRPTKFLSSKYSEKTVVTDEHYTTPIPGCLWKYNTEDYSGVSSMEECQCKCDEKSWCRSVDYIPDIKMCYLSKETKTSKPSYWYPRCYNTWRPTKFLSSEYSEKTVVTGVGSRK